MASKVTGSDIDEKELERLSSGEGARSSIIDQLANVTLQTNEEVGVKDKLSASSKTTSSREN